MPFQSNSFIRNQNFIRDRDLGPPDSTISADKVDDEFDNLGAGLTVAKTQAATAESKADLAQTSADAHTARSDDPHGAAAQAVATLRGGVVAAYDTLKKLADKLTTLVIGDVAGLQAALDSKLDDAQATPAGLAVLGAADAAAQRASLLATGNLFKITNIATVGANVHTYDPETTLAEVHLVGGGGGGGGAQAVPNAASVGGGGSGGAEAIKLVDVSAIVGNPAPRQASITIGAGGNGGTSLTGSAGDVSTYDDGTHVLSCPGGNGGSTKFQSTDFAASPGQTSAIATGGDINLKGCAAGTHIVSGYPVSNIVNAASGDGGDSSFGRGGEGKRAERSGLNTYQAHFGVDATGYGSGGGGAAIAERGDAGTSATRSGGDGAPGICIIREYR